MPRFSARATGAREEVNPDLDAGCRHVNQLLGLTPDGWVSAGRLFRRVERGTLSRVVHHDAPWLCTSLHATVVVGFQLNGSWGPKSDQEFDTPSHPPHSGRGWGWITRVVSRRNSRREFDQAAVGCLRCRRYRCCALRVATGSPAEPPVGGTALGTP